MDGDRAGGIVWLLGALVLVGSALVARRLPLARLVQLALIWASIFVAAILVVKGLGLA